MDAAGASLLLSPSSEAVVLQVCAAGLIVVCVSRLDELNAYEGVQRAVNVAQYPDPKSTVWTSVMGANTWRDVACTWKPCRAAPRYASTSCASHPDCCCTVRPNCPTYIASRLTPVKLVYVGTSCHNARPLPFPPLLLCGGCRLAVRPKSGLSRGVQQ